MAEIVMPRLSDTMEEGTILRWLKQDGEHVARGEELVEIETDKAAMVYESDEDGVLQIVAAEGDTLAVGATIAQVGDALGAGTDAGDATEAATPSPTPAKAVAPRTATPATAAPDGERVRASPVARRVAQERGVDLHGVAGSGPGGRIVKADVEGAAADSHARSAASSSPAPLAERVATAKGETTIVELTRTQQTIARRMAESKATIPDFALQMEIDMQTCVALRAELKRLSPEEAPTYNDMIVKACALALREHPRANGGYRDGKLQLHSRVNVGVAVAVTADLASAVGVTRNPASAVGVTTNPTSGVDAATDPERVDDGAPTGDALVVPTVFDADQKSLGEVARETRALAERVRAGTITPPELGGGTFTVSNLGMYGVRSFTAIVNPPQAAILSVGSLAPRAVVVDGELVARHTLTVTLACDHRILYGADAARFLARIRELLEAPAALTL